MKLSKYLPWAGVIASALLTSCSTTQHRADHSTAAQMSQIIEMNQRGELSDEQTLKVLAALKQNETATVPMKAVETAVAPDEEKETASGYQPEVVLSGRMRSVGSDTMDKLMELWADGFKVHHPGIRLYHQGRGSSTASPALTEGRSDFGPMSRKIKDKEVNAFSAKFGYEPTQLPVALDALAVYVHPSNPIAQSGMDFGQLDAVFSSTRKRGADADIVTWGQLGAEGEWSNAPIHVYSRNSASGTYGFFKDRVLKKGDYKKTNTELVGSAELVKAVELDKFGIGYSGIGYKTDAVATVPLSEKAGEEKVPAQGENAASGTYPLARFLYLTINKNPGEKAADLQREFITYVYSEEGQKLVTQDGFFPVGEKNAVANLQKVMQ